MNVGDYVRVEDQYGAIEGTVTAAFTTYFYVKGWDFASVFVDISTENKITNKITVLKSGEPMEFGTIITATAQGCRGKLVRAEPAGSEPAWYMPEDSDGNGGWFCWNDLKDVELT